MVRTRGSTAIRRRYTVGLVVAAILLVILAPITDRPEAASLDLRFRLVGEREPTGRVVLVTIDDESFRALDTRWPWPRTWLADAVSVLSAAGARAIGIDIAFSERGFTPENDAAMVEAIRLGAPVVLPEKFEIERGDEFERVLLVAPVEEYASSGARTGYVNLVEDADGRVRRLLLAQEYGGAVHRPFFVEVLEAGATTAGDAATTAGREGAGPRPSYGNTYLIPYLGPAGSLEAVSFHEVLAGTADMSRFEGAYVLVGATFKEAHDNAPTPFYSGTPMSGVEIHGQAADAVLAGRSLRAVSPLINLAILIVAAVAAAVVMNRLRPPTGAAVGIGAIVVWFILATVLFSAGIVVRVVAPGLVMILVYVGSVGYHYAVEERQGRYVRSLFSRYVAPAVVGQILADPNAVELGGELREVTLFFSDIRGFTHLSESKDPQDVVTLLNEYFDAMTTVIFEHGGTVNKFIGDAIMAFYGAPIRQEDAASRAVNACLDMRARLAELNDSWADEGRDTLRIGMALHTGPVLLGNIGSARQMEYTVIGDAVNVCSRIESMTKELKTDLLISDAVYRRIAGEVTVETHTDIPIRGRDQTITLHAVTGRIASSGGGR